MVAHSLGDLNPNLTVPSVAMFGLSDVPHDVWVDGCDHESTDFRPDLLRLQHRLQGWHLFWLAHHRRQSSSHVGIARHYCYAVDWQSSGANSEAISRIVFGSMVCEPIRGKLDSQCPPYTASPRDTAPTQSRQHWFCLDQSIRSCRFYSRNACRLKNLYCHEGNRFWLW